jgi:mRNA interferase HigB
LPKWRFGSIVVEAAMGAPPGLRRVVRVIAKKTLREFWLVHPDAEGPLLAWFREVEREDWDGPAAVKARYRSASFVGDRVVFNIKGNLYRLVVRVDYPRRLVFVRFVGTHAEYDRIVVGEV